MTAAVSSAIETLYAAFADAPRLMSIHHSPFKTLDTEALPTKPLRKLTDEDLDIYHYRVFHTIVEDSFAYFFPRLIELTHNDMSCLNTELIYQKAVLAGWQSWPPPRHAAFQSYLDAVIASFTEEEQVDIDDRVCGLGSLLSDLPEHLEILRISGTDAAQANLITLHEDNAGNSFWDKTSTAYQSYRAWLHSDTVFERVLEIYDSKFNCENIRN